MPNFMNDPAFWTQMGAAFMAGGAPTTQPGGGERALAQGLSNVSRYMTGQQRFQMQQQAQQKAQEIARRRTEILEQGARQQQTAFQQQQDREQAYQSAIPKMFPGGPPRPATPTAGPQDDLSVAGMPVTPGVPNPMAELFKAMGQKAGGNALLQQAIRKPSARYKSTPTGQILDTFTGQIQGGGGAPKFAGTGMSQQAWNQLVGGDPRSPQYAAAYAHLSAPKFDQESGKWIKTDLSMFRPPTGLAGKTTPALKKPKLSDAEAKAAGFYERMTGSEDVLARVAGQGTSWVGRRLEDIWGGNYLQSPEYQKFEQARRDFINAQLRRESGAVISVEEFQNADKQYFPQPGDTSAVIEQKARNRNRAVEAMKRSAGRNYRSPAKKSSSLPTISTDADYDKLPSGTIFIDPKGVKRMKP